MKKSHLILFAAIGLFVVSCSDGESQDGNDTEEVEAVVYSLDVSNSSLQWTGSYGENSHTGTVGISEGSITMDDGNLTEGSFVIDMTTMDEPDGQGLVNHLMGLDDDERHKPADFFNTTKFPTVTVILGNYSDGILSAKLDIMGETLPINIEVDITNDDDGASIKGSFFLDLTDLGIPGLQPDPESGEGISPAVAFELNVALKK